MTLQPRNKRARGATAVLSAALFTAMGLSAIPASADPAGTPSPATPIPVAGTHQLSGNAAKLAPGLDHSGARHSVFVELTGNGAADVAATARKNGKSKSAAATAAKNRRTSVGATAASVVRTARNADARATKIFEVANAVPGVAVTANSAALRAIAARSDVVKVTPLVPKKVSNSSTAQLTRVLDTWQEHGNTGKGVTVGVIDTGLDYTHADFGGTGTVAAWDAAHAAEKSPGWQASLPALARAKIVGGHDFTGDDYDAAPTTDAGGKNPDYQPVPHPDTNPIDCNEHGTHVSGTAAGYGVAKDGATFDGDYTTLKGGDLDDMKIGPGMAPDAKLYPLKVFGCTGSTDVVIPALDWSLDPNQDGDFADHLDIVNLSLGSDYTPVDDPENAVIDEIASQGVLPVIAMGNNGDLTDTGGSPGNAVRSLAVASSIDAMQLRDGLKVNAPAGAAGIAAGQVSVAYDWANRAPVTGDVVAIPGANADGCKPLDATDAAKVKGKVAWLEWDDNDATRACGSVGRSGNVKAAGAIGAIFTSSLNVFGAGITGDKDIPVFQLPKVQTERLRPAAEAGTLNVTFDGSLVATIKDKTPAIEDTISSFTSRGTHGSLGVVKPDVTAPGDTIASAKMGSGNDVLVISGTSMATPHTAGISALVKAAHPGWTTEQIKADVMNTAGHDLSTGENHSGTTYGPARVGAGRVDALSAVTNDVLVYSSDTPGAVSASFGVVPAPITAGTVVKARHLTVQNTGSTTVDVNLGYEAVNTQPGVSYTVSPASLTVAAGKTAEATVTMTVKPSELRHTIDPTMDSDQLGVPRQFVPDASGRVLVTPAGADALRVPVYGAAKPVSATTTTAVKDKKTRALVLHGQGFSQGSGSEAYRSLVSVLQLGASSPKLPTCTAKVTVGCTLNASSVAGDLQYVGAGSAPGETGYGSGVTWFGISTFGDWATIGNTTIPYVDFDTTGDGRADYEVYVANLTGTDVLIANTVDLRAGKVVDQQPVNFQFGDVDTNVFDTNVLLIPVSSAAIGVTDAAKKFPITYTVGMNSIYGTLPGGDIDQSGPVTFDVVKPAVAPSSPLYLDGGNRVVEYQHGSSAAQGPAKALVLHLHGAAGHRAEVVSLQ